MGGWGPGVSLYYTPPVERGPCCEALAAGGVRSQAGPLLRPPRRAAWHWSHMPWLHTHQSHTNCTPTASSPLRLNFDEFCTALRLAAFRKQLPLERVVGRVVGCAGPALRDTTTPEAVRLYDDLSTWTGEGRAGGRGRACRG